MPWFRLRKSVAMTILSASRQAASTSEIAEPYIVFVWPTRQRGRWDGWPAKAISIRAGARVTTTAH